MDIVMETAILSLSTMLTWLVPLSFPDVVLAFHRPPYLSVERVELSLSSSLHQAMSIMRKKECQSTSVFASLVLLIHILDYSFPHEFLSMPLKNIAKYVNYNQRFNFAFASGFFLS